MLLGRLNDGNLDFLPVVYELYREMLDQEVVLEKGKISSWHFKNIVNVALRSKDFEWTRSFFGAESESGFSRIIITT